MQKQFDLLRFVIKVFERLQIRYFVTGSFASMFYGEYRTTNDIDIIADLQPQHIRSFILSFPQPDFYISEDAVRDAIATRFQFNIIHAPTSLKVDVILLNPTDFDDSRMKRLRRIQATPDVAGWFASPEDVIIKKLLYFQEGESPKHTRDITGILRMTGSKLDRQYISNWANRLGVTAEWEAVVEREKEAS